MSRHAKLSASEFTRTFKGVEFRGFELFDLDEKDKALSYKKELESQGVHCKLIKKPESRAWYGAPAQWLLLTEYVPSWRQNDRKEAAPRQSENS